MKQRQAEIDKERLDVEGLWETYMQQVASQLRTRAEKDRVIRKYILPYVEGRCVTEITKNHALAALDALVAQDKRAMADKVRQEGAAFFQWLIERDHVERNDFARIRKIRTARVIRKRVLSDDEVGAIWSASEAEGHWSCWIKLLILTGGRNAEVRGACWSEFDLDARLWTIPAERYKNGYAHIVYLTDAMLAVLNAVTLVCDNLLPRSFTKISGAKALNLSHIPKMAFFHGFCGGGSSLVRTRLKSEFADYHGIYSEFCIFDWRLGVTSTSELARKRESKKRFPAPVTANVSVNSRER